MTRSAQNQDDRQRSFMSHHRTPRRRPTTFTSLIALTATLVAASLGLAACGGSSSTTTTTQTTANAAATGATTGTTPTGTSGSGTSTGTSSTATTTPGGATTGTTPANRVSRFAAVRTCLSKKGITIPQNGAGGFAGAQLPKGMSRAQFVEALQSCGTGFNSSRLGKHGKGFKNPFNNPRFHAVLARFSACLRQQGVNVGEPNTSGKGPIFNTKGINTGSPQFKAATAKCRGTLLHALQPSKAHPGASGSTTTG
jgi:hypothetical protein